MDFCSVEHCMMAVGIIGELTPSFRSRIGHDDDQICNSSRSKLQPHKKVVQNGERTELVLKERAAVQNST